MAFQWEYIFFFNFKTQLTANAIELDYSMCSFLVDTYCVCVCVCVGHWIFIWCGFVKDLANLFSWAWILSNKYTTKVQVMRAMYHRYNRHAYAGGD